MAGIRPEHFEDASLVGDQRDQGATFTAKIEIIEWMGAELYAHFTVDAPPPGELADLAADLGQAEFGEGEGAEVTARLDATSEAAEGKDLELWLDTHRIHLFDGETGLNLQHD